MNRQHAIELLSSDDWKEQFKGYYNLLKLNKHRLLEALNREYSKEFVDILELEFSALNDYITSIDRHIDFFSKGIYGKEYYGLTCKEYMENEKT